MKGIKTFEKVIYENGELREAGAIDPREAEKCRKSTIAYGILSSHNVSGNDKELRIKFDALASHDITYVGIIQTARASGLKEFPVPYVLTNCHNSLCAVGGTINEDDHVFGLSAAKKYGGIFVPPHVAVIHQYMRECFAAPGKMILGSDSHTRYGALGCLAVGEGGPELVKQILSRTYDVAYPDIVAVKLKGRPIHGVGPQDVALALIKATFENGFAKNSVLEFIGDGINSLSMDFRIGIDVMTTETTCLSSVWETDEKTKEYLKAHGRENEYKEMKIDKAAYYDRAIEIDLSETEPMIALPFHPSNAYTIKEFNQDPYDILRDTEEKAKKLFSGDIDFMLTDKLYSGRLCVDQGVIAGCAGGSFENLYAAANILKGRSTGCFEFSLSVYPSSLPVMYESVKNDVIDTFIKSGTIVKTAFCGPCFGAGDVPCNKGLSIRHSTRNFPNREGSKPAKHQIASVALMDARSIAATAANKGVLTPATEFDYEEFSETGKKYGFDKEIYASRVYNGFSSPKPESALRFGPGITDWPEQIALKDDILLKFAAVIDDPVTTTDELIPSGETSSFRSDPLTLAEFTLSRKVPEYVGRAKDIFALERSRRNGEEVSDDVASVFGSLKAQGIKADPKETEIGSVIFAVKPGDGSAREQAASCQRVLGGMANIAKEYATKRYRSNLINWGMLPFTYDKNVFSVGDHLFIGGIKAQLEAGARDIIAHLIRSDGSVSEITLHLHEMTEDERKTILCGCLANFYRQTAG